MLSGNLLLAPEFLYIEGSKKCVKKKSLISKYTHVNVRVCVLCIIFTKLSFVR